MHYLRFYDTLSSYISVSLNSLQENVPAYRENLAIYVNPLEASLARIGIDASNLSEANLFSPQRLAGAIGTLLAILVNSLTGVVLALLLFIFPFLAIFPLLLFIGIALSYLFEDPNLQEQILSYIFTRVTSLTGTVKNTIEGLIQARASAGLITALGLLWSATGLFSGLSVGLNVVYGVRETRNVVSGTSWR